MVFVCVNRGPGGIVRIFTKSVEHLHQAGNSTFQDQDWELVYSGPNNMYQYCVDQTKGDPCAARLQYNLCPRQEMVIGVRLELEMDDPARFFAIDAILLIGASDIKSNSLMDTFGRYFVKPVAQFSGTDSLEVQVRMCFIDYWSPRIV